MLYQDPTATYTRVYYIFIHELGTKFESRKVVKLELLLLHMNNFKQGVLY
jgi:hypothetical protein